MTCLTAGSIFVGTQGTMVLPHVNRPLLYPDAKFKDFNYPDRARRQPLGTICPGLPRQWRNHGPISTMPGR